MYNTSIELVTGDWDWGPGEELRSYSCRIWSRLGSVWGYRVLSRTWIGSPLALRERKKWRIPLCAITSTVEVARTSWTFLSVGPGWSMVGPNTVARLW